MRVRIGGNCHCDDVKTENMSRKIAWVFFVHRFHVISFLIMDFESSASLCTTMNSSFAFFDEDVALQSRHRVPFYYTERPSLLPFLSDQAVSLLAPILAYWTLSLSFHLLDAWDPPSLQRYRIHESKELKTRNRATPGEVLRAVVVQHILQTLLGWFWMNGPAEVHTNHVQNMRSYDRVIIHVVQWCLGENIARYALETNGAEISWFMYWWGVPTAQFFFAMCVSFAAVFMSISLLTPLCFRFVIDTWQYFLHRLFHVNKFLYKHVHSVHHRLYVPYAFGALYNHPVEGFVLDSLGAVIAHSASFMSLRQAILLFTVSTLKTVDDHCGYRLPYDPLQILSGNNSDYHDIHHQVNTYTMKMLIKC